MRSPIAFFDFDGTITRSDTLFEIIKFHVGKRKFYTGMAKLAPALVLFKLKMRSAQRIKEQVLAHFFAGMTVKEFDILCYRFCLERLPQLIRPSALERIRYHQEQEHLVYIVSASVENWVRPWAHQHGVSVIASRLDNRAGIITGKLAGLNCNGPEKVARIQKEVYVPSDIRVYAYGDTSGDRPMLALATDRGFRIFND